MKQAFGRLDVQTGELQTWAPGPRCFSEELIFVPGPNATEVEDDGYLLGMVFDAERFRSSLVVCCPAATARRPPFFSSRATDVVEMHHRYIDTLCTGV